MIYLLVSDTQSSWQNYKLTEDLLEWLDSLTFDAFLHAGDMKHHLNPVDNRVLEQWVNWLRKTAKRTVQPPILLAGNHDATSVYDTEYAWLRVVGHATGSEVIWKPGVSKDKELNSLYFLPFSRQASTEWIPALNELQYKVSADLFRKKPTRNYLFLHGDVMGAEWQGYPITEGIRLEDLPFDFSHVFAGHIHKRQTILDTATYIGSPFAHDWNEVNQRKGVILLDTETNTWKFKESPIPGLYDPNLPGKCPSNIRSVRIKVPYETAEELVIRTQEVRAHWQKQYPNVTIETIPEPIQTASQTSTTVSTVDAAIHSYCESFSQSTPGLEARLRYLVNTSMRPVDSLRFLRLEGKNVLSFEDIKVDFTKTGGLKLILGENRDWPGRSNGAGKSAFLSMALLAIEGKTLKEQEADAWRKRNSTGPCYLRFWFEVGGKEYLIERTRKPQTLRLWCGDQELSTADTQSRIRELMGLSWLLATSTLYVDQGKVHELVSGTDANKKKLLYDFLNLGMFQSALEIAKQHRKRAEQAIEQWNNNLITAEAEYQREVQARERLERDRPQGCGEALAQTIKEVTAHLKKEPAEPEKPGPRFAEIVFEDTQITKQLNQLATAGPRTCPTCGQSVSGKDTSKLRSELQAKRDALRKEGHHFIAMKEAYDAYEQAWERWTQKTDSLKAKLIKLEAELKNEQAWDAKIQEQIILVQEAKQHLKRLRTYEPILKEMLAFEKDVVAALGKDGVPAILCQNICPVLNASAAAYSEMLTDSELKVTFAIENEAFKINIENPHGGNTVKDQSAGELHMISLITAFALRDLYTRTNFLVVDEPAESLDEVNARKLARAMHRLGARYDTLYVSTHNVHAQQELASAGVLRIVKENGTSCLLMP